MTTNDAWRKDAACKGKPATWWFPPSNPTIEDLRNTRTAVKICNECPVRETCLEAGMSPRENGIWGGKTTSQRRRMRHARLRVAQ